ncbi:MAG: molybdopterin-dependent oxidoreductase [Candidatus Adiutrix sp.]|nr:molybdopterin-dependent oxidoreductase [Candidatus Adiutrix sp.]
MKRFAIIAARRRMTRQERLLKAKIPGPESGIEIRHTFCSICEPLFHCGIDAYVKDGLLLKIEGTPGHPMNNGRLCPRGHANRQYIYRADRIRTPLGRIGPRGGDGFEEISWDEAYREIAARLRKIKATFGPESVLFFSGYAKWYRSFLQRLAHAFGSPNFGSESSTCHMATLEAWRDMVGRFSGYDVQNAATFMAWAVNPFHSKPTQLRQLYEVKERGQKIVVIDPRVTPTSSKLADLHLRLKPGTDGALALGLGKLVIDNGWLDEDYVRNHVHGFESYAQYVRQFDLRLVSRITGLEPRDVEKAAELYATNKPSCISQSGAPIVHHSNGYQTFRAIMSLSALTGNYDVPGGNFPIGETYAHQWAGFETREPEFRHGNFPPGAPPRIGDLRFPLWRHFMAEGQMTDLTRQIREGRPYPLKAVMAFGLNHRMFPEAHKILEAMDSLDFVMSAELFMTETCRHSDIVLPVCSSFEREEFKVYPGGYATYIRPVIPPLHQSRPDSTVIKELAEALELDDQLLRSGYENCVRWMLSGCRLDLDDCKNSDLPVKVPDFRPYEAGAYTAAGYDTPTGKFEIYSTSIERQAPGLDPLPVYSPPYDQADPAVYPLILSIGARLPFALHSRLHQVPWTRSLRPEPMADISRQDAEELGIAEGEVITIESPTGHIVVRANPSERIMKGCLQMYHGYQEADANELITERHLDPYSGYPGYNCVRCRIRKGGAAP